MGRVLIALTVLVAIAVVVVPATVTYVAAALVCVCWVAVYHASDPMARRADGDDPAQDAVSWRDREI